MKVVGDEFLSTFGRPARAIRCACAISEAVRGLEVRAGLHTGEIELRGDDIGLAVDIGARVAALAESGEVLVSGRRPPLVAGSGLRFTDKGARRLKGVPGEWSILRSPTSGPGGDLVPQDLKHRLDLGAEFLLALCVAADVLSVAGHKDALNDRA